MARVTYIQPGGTERVVEVPNGLSLMKGAVDSGVVGIVGLCGGGASCGTCHVFIESGGERLESMHPVEDELLFCTAEPRRPESRLSCQLESRIDVDGVRLRIPDRQISELTPRRGDH